LNLKCFAYLVASLTICAAPGARAQATLPNGMWLTPTAAPGAHFAPLNPHLPAYPRYTAGQAVSTAVSPDGKTLLILTSGFNLWDNAQGKIDKSASHEYVFVDDIANGTPRQLQALQLPNTYMGIAFSPDGRHVYVSGGVDDDVHVFDAGAQGWAERSPPIDLGHYKGVDRKSKIYNGGAGLGVQPQVSGIAVSADGKTLAATNFYNDSLSLIDLPTGRITPVPLRPGDISKAQTGVPGGEYPFAVIIKGNDTAYISSLRDREIDVVTLKGTPHLTARIKVDGNPNRLALTKDGDTLYSTVDNLDAVIAIDTRTNRIVQTIRTIAPPDMLADSEHYRGVGPNNLALSPDEKTLYVTNGGTNSVAVIALGAHAHVTGLIPTGYFPNAVSVNGAGDHLYIVNGKSIPGPNPGNCTIDPGQHITAPQCHSANQYVLQLSKAGFLDLPVPTAVQLAETTKIAAHDAHFDEMPSPADVAMMAALHQRIHHIIYILRENRTYDEELGDLGEGNGDARLAEFGAVITPNDHAMARNFVDLDNFEDTGEVSGNGWPWSTAARESDIGAKNLPINYADRGLSYDWEGTNRNIDVAIPTLAAREAAQPLYSDLPDAANILPGEANVAAPDGPKGQFQRGYLWDAALRAGLTVRNYGFYLDLARYEQPLDQGGIPPTLTDPAASQTVVAFPANPVLAPRTDPYFRGFDLSFPDYFREVEWQREFTRQIAQRDMPNLTLLRLMRDHLGAFKTAIDGTNTPETEMADDDYAVGLVIQAVAHSPYANDTLIFVVEDDAQNGPDHVDAHRSVAYIVGPYVKQHAVISTRYSTVNFLRTMEDILGTDHLSISDAFQRPMADVFDLGQKSWSFTAVVPTPLDTTTLPIPHQATSWHPAHPASYWTAKTRGYDWRQEDRIPAIAFNEILWQGLEHSPYPGPKTAPKGDGDDDDD
jgi:DNA-binding beta-propeller fold protein YncE